MKISALEACVPWSLPRPQKNEALTGDFRETKEEKKCTPKGSRTPAACLEGKHDNRFTIGVWYHVEI